MVAFGVDYENAIVGQDPSLGHQADQVTFPRRGGAGNEDAREHLKWGSWKATSVVPQNNEDGMQTHVRTNEVAIGMLKDEVAFGMPEEAAFGMLQ